MLWQENERLNSESRGEIQNSNAHTGTAPDRAVQIFCYPLIATSGSSGNPESEYLFSAHCLLSVRKPVKASAVSAL